MIYLFIVAVITVGLAEALPLIKKKNVERGVCNKFFTRNFDDAYCFKSTWIIDTIRMVESNTHSCGKIHF